MKWCSLEPAKRIGLCCPIQIPERRRVPMGLMLRPFVVVVRIDGYWKNVIRSRRPSAPAEVRRSIAPTRRVSVGIRAPSVVVRIGTVASTGANRSGRSTPIPGGTQPPGLDRAMREPGPRGRSPSARTVPIFLPLPREQTSSRTLRAYSRIAQSRQGRVPSQRDAGLDVVPPSSEPRAHRALPESHRALPCLTPVQGTSYNLLPPSRTQLSWELRAERPNPTATPAAWFSWAGSQCV